MIFCKITWMLRRLNFLLEFIEGLFRLPFFLLPLLRWHAELPLVLWSYTLNRPPLRSPPPPHVFIFILLHPLPLPESFCVLSTNTASCFAPPLSPPLGIMPFSSSFGYCVPVDSDFPVFFSPQDYKQKPTNIQCRKSKNEVRDTFKPPLTSMWSHNSSFPNPSRWKSPAISLSEDI